METTPDATLEDKKGDNVIHVQGASQTGASLEQGIGVHIIIKHHIFDF